MNYDFEIAVVSLEEPRAAGTTLYTMRDVEYINLEHS
jgi:hypothetical protein